MRRQQQRRRARLRRLAVATSGGQETKETLAADAAADAASCCVCYQGGLGAQDRLRCGHDICQACFRREVSQRRVEMDPPLPVLCPLCRALVPDERWTGMVPLRLGGPDAASGALSSPSPMHKTCWIWYHRLTLRYKASRRVRRLVQEYQQQQAMSAAAAAAAPAATSTMLSMAELDVVRLACTTRPCPCCNVRIERVLGCSVMHCTRCSTSFCWNCQNPDASVLGCKRCRFSLYNQLFPIDLALFGVLLFAVLVSPSFQGDWKTLMLSSLAFFCWLSVYGWLLANDALDTILDHLIAAQAISF